MAGAEERDESFVLVIAPERTRSRMERWKTGFYHIHIVARGAGVPVALGYADYPGRRVGVGGWLLASGDLEADMEEIRVFYADRRGRRRENQGPVRASAGPTG